MTSLRRSLALAALATTLTLGGAACGDFGKDAAEQSLQALQAKYDTIKADAQHYLPEQADMIENAYDSVKARVANGEYMKGLKEAQALTAKLGQLETILGARRAELERSWAAVSAAIPGSVERLQAHLEALQQNSRLPKGITKDAQAAAEAALPALRAQWERAVAAAKAADFTAALEQAAAVKARALELMASLGVPPAERRPPASPAPRD